MRKKSFRIFIGLLVLAFLTGQSVYAGIEKRKTPLNQWTIMHYGSTANSAEETIMEDYAEMKKGFINNQGVELLVLLDRIKGFSEDKSVFGENFYDTRLYRITHNKTERLDGGAEFSEITKISNYDANMADAQTLKKFIRFCKANYPAKHYALIIYTHGSGPYLSRDEDKGSEGDVLYTAEITDVLTSEESVDFMAFDVCLMGGVENAYQWRPGNGSFNTQIMVASAPSTGPYAYDKIFQRLKSGGGDNGETDTMVGGKEKYYNPATMTPLELGGLLLEEIYDGQPEESWACYDLRKVDAVKNCVDSLAVNLVKEGKKEDFEEIRGSGCLLKTLNYMMNISDRGWMQSPFFDLYDLAKRTYQDSNFSETILSNVLKVMKAVDDMIVYSYGGAQYPRFENGKHGLYIFFPDGDRIVMEKRHWTAQTWYNAVEVTEPPKDWPKGLGKYLSYGKYFWCKDGAIPNNNRVENWFEMLDSWFDRDNKEDGGLNRYQW